MDFSVFEQAGLRQPRGAVLTAGGPTLPHLSLGCNSFRARGGLNVCVQGLMHLPTELSVLPCLPRAPLSGVDSRFHWRSSPTFYSPGWHQISNPTSAKCARLSLSFLICKMEIVPPTLRKWQVEPNTWYSAWHGVGARVMGAALSMSTPYSRDQSGTEISSLC